MEKALRLKELVLSFFKLHIPMSSKYLDTGLSTNVKILICLLVWLVKWIPWLFIDVFFFLLFLIVLQQPNKTVTLVTVGFLTNLASLIDSKPDEFSRLSGKKFVKKKI